MLIAHVSCGHDGCQNVLVYEVEVKFASLKSFKSPSLGQGSISNLLLIPFILTSVLPAENIMMLKLMFV